LGGHVSITGEAKNVWTCRYGGWGGEKTWKKDELH